MSVEEIEQAIAGLSAEEYQALRHWLDGFEHQQWLRREIQKGVDDINEGRVGAWNADEVRALGRELLAKKREDGSVG